MPGYSYRTQLWSRARTRNARSLALTRSKALAPLSYEQEGFRFRNDDGSETTATWKANQDTNITLAQGDAVRIRVLTNVTNDAPSLGVELQFRKSGDTPYKDVRGSRP